MIEVNTPASFRSLVVTLISLVALEIMFLVYSFYREKVALPTIINLHFTNKKNNVRILPVININMPTTESEIYDIFLEPLPLLHFETDQPHIPFISLDFPNPSIKLVSGPVCFIDV